MSDFFTIYVDRLKNGHTDRFSSSVSADFLDCNDRDLQFTSPVDCSGEAYIASDHLVVHISAATVIGIPCSICNKTVLVPIAMKNFYMTKPLQECSSTYNFQNALREELLLEVPPFSECAGGCKNRKFVEKFMKKEDPPGGDTPHFPFASLDDPKDLGDNYGRT
ncbi:MAG: hypothetical protein AAGI90_02500 [Chlamydiota bacterium]